uniref:Uncharacterized protein n=1 Tax=Aegilops tauschii subsp. strangulata TaxID=200361 RepID=A0A453RID2_AEGTS
MAHSDLEPLRSGAAALPSSSDPDSPTTPRRNRVRELLRNLDRRLSSRGRHNHVDSGPASPTAAGEAGAPRREEESDELGDGAPPEWALLLVGCLLGLATGICVAAFNRGVSKRSACRKNALFISSSKRFLVGEIVFCRDLYAWQVQ